MDADLTVDAGVYQLARTTQFIDFSVADLQATGDFHHVEELVRLVPILEHGVGETEVGGGDRVAGLPVKTPIEFEGTLHKGFLMLDRVIPLPVVVVVVLLLVGGTVAWMAWPQSAPATARKDSWQVHERAEWGEKELLFVSYTEDGATRYGVDLAENGVIKCAADLDEVRQSDKFLAAMAEGWIEMGPAFFPSVPEDEFEFTPILDE